MSDRSQYAPMATDATAKASREVAARDRLRIEQSQWTPLWRDCTAFCCPHKQKAVDNSYAQLTQQVRPRFNPMRQSSTAIDALNTASGGVKSWIIPGGDEGWGGQWEAPPMMKSIAVKDWYADCTLRSIAPMKSGSFFTAVHEMIQDLLVFGTAGILIDEGNERLPMYCEAIMPINFVFERDWTGEVLRVIITWSKPANLIKEQFSRPGDRIPEAVQNDIGSNGGNVVHELIQSIYRRSDKEREEEREDEPKGQVYGSCWIHVATKTVMRERGYPECPFFAPRWNTWAGTGPSNYGTSPAMQAIADIKGVNLMDMVIATRAELEINPRVKVAPSQTSPVDLSPGGLTMVNDMNDVDEWGVVKGSYPAGVDQIERIERRINRAFFKDLFEAVTPVAQEREITNYVADAIKREAAAKLTPAIERFEQDFFDGAMRRVFNILARAGYFEDPPEEAGYRDSVSGVWQFAPPQAIQSNRWTRTVNARKGQAFIQSVTRDMQIAAIDPTIMDKYNFDLATRELSRNDGLPPEWFFTIDEVQKKQAERAAAAQQQMVQQTASQALIKDPVGLAELAGIGPAASAA